MTPLEAINEEMRNLGRPLPPFSIILDRRKMQAWREAIFLPWIAANPEADEKWHTLKAQAVAISDAKDAESLREAMRVQSRAHVERWAGEVTALALDNPKDTYALTEAKRWYPEASWVLMLLGDSGLGKSVAAAWCAREAWVAHGSVRWIPCNQQQLERHFGPDADRLRTAATNATLLVIDDLERERSTDAWVDWLKAVLHQRHAHQRKTIITSNKGGTVLEARLGPATWDRLADGGAIKACHGASMRRERRSA